MRLFFNEKNDVQIKGTAMLAPVYAKSAMPCLEQTYQEVKENSSIGSRSYLEMTWIRDTLTIVL